MSNTANNEPAAEKTLEINKYSNRRFYDKTRSRHLTLEEIYAAIRDGYEIRVTDSKSGQDITAKILAQIILELDPPKLDVFPVALLHRLLRTNEQLIADFTEKYFSQALTTFLDSQKKTEQYLRQTMGLPPVGGLMTDWAKLMLGPFHPGSWPGAQPASQAGSEAPSVSSLVSQIEQLQQKIVQLQDELAKSRRARRGSRPKQSK